jgi:hypothetical protein
MVGQPEDQRTDLVGGHDDQGLVRVVLTQQLEAVDQGVQPGR